MGVTPQAVAFWRDGKRGLPERLAARLETATGCVVRRWDMFPLDWHRIWPELVGTPGAPEVPEHDAGPVGSRAEEARRVVG